MSHYLDASALVSIFYEDAHSGTALAQLGGMQRLLVSDFAAAEFAAAIARLHRMARLDVGEAEAIFSNFDRWNGSRTVRVGAMPPDMATAAQLVRRLALGLRAPDALHIAIAGRVRATLVTFDQRMAAAARSLGVPVAAA